PLAPRRACRRWRLYFDRWRDTRQPADFAGLQGVATIGDVEQHERAIAPRDRQRCLVAEAVIVNAFEDESYELIWDGTVRAHDNTGNRVGGHELQLEMDTVAILARPDVDRNRVNRRVGAGIELGL